MTALWEGCHGNPLLGSTPRPLRLALPLLRQSHLSLLTVCLSSAFFLLFCIQTVLLPFLRKQLSNIYPKTLFLISELFTDRLKATCCWKALVILPIRSAC